MVREILLQHGVRPKWESAHDWVSKDVKTELNSGNGVTLTIHIAAYRLHLVDLKRCCKRTGRSPLTVREQVLWMVNSITTTDPSLNAHIAQINGDLTGIRMNFEAAATHLMLTDPVERTSVKSKRRRILNPSISLLAGRGESGVDFRWHNQNEFKELTQDKKDELSAWRNTAAGKASMEAAKTKFKAKRDEKKQKQEGGGGNNGGLDKNDKGADILSNKKLQKKFQVAVAKASKKIVAASIEAKKAEVAAVDLSLEAVIKRRGDKTPVISATLVKDDDEAAAEKKFTQQQTKIKLSLSRPVPTKW